MFLPLNRTIPPKNHKNHHLFSSFTTTMPPATNANTSYTDYHVAAQFTIIYPTENCGFLSKKGQCNHCKSAPKSWNITQNQKPHLTLYEPYQKWRTTQGLDPLSASQKQPAIDEFFTTKDAKAEDLFALVIYTSTASFSIFNIPEWKAFYAKLNFVAPSRKVLLGNLLDKYYNRIKAKVQEVANGSSHI